MSIHRISNAAIDVVQAVYLDERKLVTHAFMPLPDEPTVNLARSSYDTIINAAMAALDNPQYRRGNGRFAPVPPLYVEGIPGDPRFFAHVGSNIFHLDGKDQLGANEWTDHALFELASDAKGLISLEPWRNRFALSSAIKAPLASRWRNVWGIAGFGSIYMPFKKDSLLDLRIELKSTDRFIKLNEFQEGTPVNEASETAPIWQSHYWRVTGVDQTLPVAGGKIDARLVWHDGTDCTEATELTVEADAGYLPRRKIKFVNGAASIPVNPLGLFPMDEIELKFSVGPYSNVGKVKATVV